MLSGRVVGFGGLTGPPGSIDPVVVDRISAALGRRHRRPTQAETHADAAVALVQSVSGPVGIPARDQVWLCWHGRLDNRERLDAELGGGSPVDDRDRIVRAYRRWGPGFCAHLVGDYVLALWDARDLRLVLARDPMGTRPVFYAHRPGGSGLVWATRLEAVRAAGDVGDEIDEGWIAGYLTLAPRGDETPYRAIRAVPPGHVLVAGHDRTDISPFWTLDLREEARLRDDAEYEARFVDLFAEAMRTRLNDDVVMADLSGGLDSSSIVCVASRMIREGQVAANRLVTVSSVYESSPTSDERRHIRVVERHIDQHGLHLGDDDGRPFDDMERAECEYPTWFEGVKVHHGRRREVADAHGIDTSLSGLGGDQLLHSQYEPALPLADLLWRGELATFCKRLPAARRGQNVSYPSLISSSVAMALTPRIRARRRLRHEYWTATFDSLAPQLQRRTDLADRIAEFLPAGDGPPSKQVQLASLKHAIHTVAWQYETGPAPLLVTYPYLHLPLVEFCLATPSDQFIRYGQTRSLHRRALRPFLPEQTADRRSKQGPDEAILRGLAGNWAGVTRLVRSPLIVEYGFIDAQQFDRYLQQARFGHHRRIPLWFIVKVLALEAWLRGHVHAPV